MERIEKIWEYILDNGIATEEEIQLVRALVSGSVEEVLNDIIWVRTGYRSYDQLIEAEEE